MQAHAQMQVIASVIILIDTVIKQQGLERTLEQIREVTSANPNSNRIEEHALKAWEGVREGSIKICKMEAILSKYEEEKGGEKE